MATAHDIDSRAPFEAEGAAGRARARRNRRLRFALSIAVGLVALGFATDAVTSSPAICGSCHEMSQLHRSWSVSAHVGVECVECHQPRRAWYALPLTLGDRTALLARDTVRHFRNPGIAPLDIDASTPPMASEVCLQCHAPDREATSGFRILIDHPEHAERNGSCVSCHVRTAHPVAERGRAITLMAQCYTCHGDPKTPEAKTDCRLCHPKEFDLVPASHKPAAWAGSHGKTGLSDRAQCSLCHHRDWCVKCHGVEMPHPSGWSKAGESAHAKYDTSDRAVCAKCHKAKPDLCSRCHHQAWNPALGTWQQQHHFEVAEKGVTPCMNCHGALFCTRCHVKFASEAARAGR